MTSNSPAIPIIPAPSIKEIISRSFSIMLVWTSSPQLFVHRSPISSLHPSTPPQSPHYSTRVTKATLSSSYPFVTTSRKKPFSFAQRTPTPLGPINFTRHTSSDTSKEQPIWVLHTLLTHCTSPMEYKLPQKPTHHTHVTPTVLVTQSIFFALVTLTPHSSPSLPRSPLP